MAQKFTIYPLGNAETCLLELNNGGKILFDYAAMNDGSETDDRFDIERELSSIKEFDVVMFSHAHEDWYQWLWPHRPSHFPRCPDS